MKQKLQRNVAHGIVMFILAVVCNQQTHAQFSIGVSAGYANNYLVTNVSNLVSTEYKSLPGFSAAVPMMYSIEDWFAIKAEPGFMQKNYRMQRTGFYQGIYQDNTNGYIQLPVMGHFSFGGENLRGYIDAGGYAGYWLTAHVKGVMPNILDQPAYSSAVSNEQPNNVFDEYTPYSYNEKYQFNTTKDNRIELGILAGAGISYQVNDSYQLFAQASYYESLTDQQKKYETGQVPRYNQTYVFNLGVMFTLGSSGY
ncbi:MAG TPA: porin family protein [Chitinophagaceae bacterium]|nr:porin family protein [Chitinophagaceae bacterium]